jgi:hypothetical protein
MDKRDFWTTLPGMLTGVAAILSALTGVYLAVRDDDSTGSRPDTEVASQPTGGAREPAVRTIASISEWPVIVSDTFSDAASQWPRGNFPEGALKRFELSVSGGTYRWNIETQDALSKSINAPFGFVKDFFVSVDVVVRQHSVEPIDVGLIFGAAAGSDFRLLFKSPGSIGVSRATGTTINDLLVNWTPIDAPMNQRNKVAVLIDGGRMSFYVNDKEVASHSDDRYVGGSLGLSVGLYSAGTAAIEFDNFELRRRP